MSPVRALLTLTTLLATAVCASAQTPPPDASNPAPLPVLKVHPLDATAQAHCPLIGCSWCGSMLEQMTASWKQMRLMVAAQKQEGCCEVAKAVVKDKPAPKACACAKACACCESCKAKKKDATAALDCMPQEIMQRLAALRGISVQPAPLAMPCPMVAPPVHGSGIVQIMPVPSVRVIELVQVAQPMKPAHLVTPDLDAHCERMSHHGDTVVLEGNVLLLCKKHAQPIRIEAQRVVVNMKDGSFTVESAMRSTTTSTGFGIQRTSHVEPSAQSGFTPMRQPMAIPSGAQPVPMFWNWQFK